MRSSRGARGICAGTAQRGGREAGTRSVTLLLRLPLRRGQGGDSVRPRRSAAGEETGEEGLVRTTVSVPQSRHLLTLGLCFMAKCCAGGGGRGKGPGTLLSSHIRRPRAGGRRGTRSSTASLSEPSRGDTGGPAEVVRCERFRHPARGGGSGDRTPFCTSRRRWLMRSPGVGPRGCGVGVGPFVDVCLRGDHPLFSRTWLSVHISVCGQLSHS